MTGLVSLLARLRSCQYTVYKHSNRDLAIRQRQNQFYMTGPDIYLYRLIIQICGQIQLKIAIKCQQNKNGTKTEQVKIN